MTQVGYLRPHNRHKHYHNLYFVGASTHPGTGQLSQRGLLSPVTDVPYEVVMKELADRGIQASEEFTPLDD